jgi:hypothetical protein
MCEKIQDAAVLLDGNVYSLPRPARHDKVLRSLYPKWKLALDSGRPTRRVQGFITTKGRFVDREEAMVIAKREGQLIVEPRYDDKLFSEDLW